MSEFFKRYISGFVALALLVLLFYLGDYAVSIACIIFSLLMIFEYNRAVKIRGSMIAYFSALIMSSAVIFRLPVEPIVALIISAHIVLFVFTKCTIGEFALSSLSILYIVLPVFFGLRILRDFGIMTFLLSLLIPMCTDIFAYIVGKWIGRTPLIPKISPKKTVEGLLGGVIFSTVLSALYIHFFIVDVTGKLAYFVVLAVCFSVLSQFGDFAASKIKRELGIKDYGDLIPGHGGVMDRFDSYLLVFPPFFALMNLMR